MHFPRCSFLIGITLVGVLGFHLEAQGFYGSGVSARTAARAGIYVPSSDNPLDALVLNPAGLTVLNRPTISLSVNGVLARGSFTDATNNNSLMRFTGGIVPFGAFGMPIGHSRWSVGLAITPDFLSSAKWQYRDAPGTAGANYGANDETSQIVAFRSSAGVGFFLNPKLSVGATLGAVYNSNMLDAPYIFQQTPALQGLKTLLDLRTTGIGWNGSVGVLAAPVRTIELGASYRSRTSITSAGSATGNIGAQLTALGIPFQPGFAYRAQVQVQLPQSALVSAVWQATPVLRFSAQGDWVNWSRSFHSLPVSLTSGTNADINQLLHSDRIKDAIPLDWKDQFIFRGGIERNLGESFSLSGGFLHGNNPVPTSTLTPLTAAIMKNGLTTGAGYKLGRYRFDVSYGVDLNASERVRTSALKAGEYSNSTVKVETQGLTVSTSLRL